MRRLALATAVLALALPMPCRAALVTAQLSGVVKTVGYRDRVGDLFQFTEGESFRFTFDYDPSVPILSLDPPSGSYSLTPAFANELTTSTGFRVSFNDFSATVLLSESLDQVQLSFAGPGTLLVSFVDRTSSILASDALPTIEQLLRFGPARINYARVVEFPPDRNLDFSTFDGDATLTVAGVPEPSSLALAGIGLAMVAGWVWKRNRPTPLLRPGGS